MAARQVNYVAPMYEQKCSKFGVDIWLILFHTHQLQTLDLQLFG